MKLLLFLLLLPGALAYTPWVIGKVTTQGLWTANGIDCVKYQTTNQLNPFHGEILWASMDPTDPANAAAIAQNGGPIIFNLLEFCDNGQLIEFACSYAYPQYLPNLWGAIQLAPQDMTSFGSPPNQWTCTDFTGSNYQNGAYQGNVKIPAFYTPTIPGYQFTTTTSTPLPKIAGWINNNQLGGSISAPTGSNFTIDAAYVIGPLPSQTAYQGTLQINCGTSCVIPNTMITCPGIYQVIGLMSNSYASAVSVAC